jgi:hypothetical protein
LTRGARLVLESSHAGQKENPYFLPATGGMLSPQMKRNNSPGQAPNSKLPRTGKVKAPDTAQLKRFLENRRGEFIEGAFPTISRDASRPGRLPLRFGISAGGVVSGIGNIPTMGSASAFRQICKGRARQTMPAGNIARLERLYPSRRCPYGDTLGEFHSVKAIIGPGTAHERPLKMHARAGLRL